MSRKPLKHFTFEERQIIESLIKERVSLKTIADKINRSYGGVLLEVTRAGGWLNYDAMVAHENSIGIRKTKKHPLKGQDRPCTRALHPTQLKDEEFHRIGELLKEGRFIESIADELGRVPKTIQTACNIGGGRHSYCPYKAIEARNATYINRKPTERFTDDEKTELKFLYEAGYKFKEIAVMINRPLSSVRGYINGLKKRPIQISVSEIKRVPAIQPVGEPVDVPVPEEDLPAPVEPKEPASFATRLDNVEMQLEILSDVIKEFINGRQ